MSESEFNISLGGGLYMDSNGNVQRCAFPAASTYTLPGGGILPITQEAFEKALTGTTKALQGIVKVLPDPNDPDSIKRGMRPTFGSGGWKHRSCCALAVDSTPELPQFCIGNRYPNDRFLCFNEADGVLIPDKPYGRDQILPRQPVSDRPCLNKPQGLLAAEYNQRIEEIK